MERNWFHLCCGVGTGILISWSIVLASVVYWLDVVEWTLNNVFTLVFLAVGVAFFLFAVLCMNIKLRDFTFFVSLGFLFIFTYYLLSAVYPVYPPEFYTSWDFHDCMIENDRNLGVCNQFLTENTRYTYYPPLIHLVGGLINIRWLMILTLLLFWFVLALGTDSFVTPCLVFFSAPMLWFTFVRGGVLPFFITLFISVLLLLYWSKLNWFARSILVLIALTTHVYGGWVVLTIAALFTTGELLELNHYQLTCLVSLFSISLIVYFYVHMGDGLRVLLIPLTLIPVMLLKKVGGEEK